MKKLKRDAELLGKVCLPKCIYWSGTQKMALFGNQSHLLALVELDINGYNKVIREEEKL